MEKLKNFLYDISDVVISLVIIFVMFFALYNKLNTSITDNSFKFINIKNKIVKKDENIKTNIVVDTSKKDENIIINENNTQITEIFDENKFNDIIKNEKLENENVEISKDVDNVSIEKEGTTEEEKNQEEDLEKLKEYDNIQEDVIIVIPGGASGVKIGRILVSNNVINDVNEFIAEVNRRKVGNYLRAGTFRLKTNMSVQDAVKALTR